MATAQVVLWDEGKVVFQVEPEDEHRKIVKFLCAKTLSELKLHLVEREIGFTDEAGMLRMYFRLNGEFILLNQLTF
jgi:hypothetical protein